MDEQQENLNLIEEFLKAALDKPGNKVAALLVLKNISQSDIARRHGVAPADLSRVVSGQRKTVRLQNIIADELGIPRHVLFPRTERT